ncbi:MAG: SAM-dependent methyltransferase, partial [Vicinamibacterales bacterium]|nr:SAM-dependent methyltransferase [Vicinamibacterales bacterium]
GYYARAAQRSGGAGDFVTSVDIGPLFGALLASNVAGMARSLDDGNPSSEPAPVDLVEAAAGNGRLSRDILDALSRRFPALYDRIRLTLVERSASARGAHAATLAAHARHLRASREDLPAGVDGLIFCNELLDAMPVHVVTVTAGGLAEVFVDLVDDRLAERLGPPSTPALGAYFESLGIRLDPGARAEVNLAALAWIREAAAALSRGFLLVIDYGHEAAQLFSSPHAGGTLRTFHRHLADAPATSAAAAGTPPWLIDPGSRDLTTHVDLTSVRRTAEAAGLVTVLDTDQSRFLLGEAERSGLIFELEAPERLRDRLALKTLLVPGGMGTTHRVLAFAKDVPALSTAR